MLKSHVKFHSSNGKRQILVVDDEAINREMLGMILGDDYDISYAENGYEALEKIRENARTLSLVMLDLLMPGMHGLELLQIMKDDENLSSIPVIVLTSEKDMEVASLHQGASDFIPKPYDLPEVIQARVQRTIELYEDRQIIQSTERDVLTGLYNKEYFYRYAEQFDRHHAGMSMDAIMIDVNHFHMVNERYGRSYGDGVLRRIGGKVLEAVSGSGGIVCRRESDTFMIYLPHGNDYKEILECASIQLPGIEGKSPNNGNRIRLRMGVYENVDKSLSIEHCFDRAKIAADNVRGNYRNNIGFYDNDLHEKELFAERLIEELDQAMAEKQLKVFFQPKYNIQGEAPRLCSAEALIRWQHPEFGMISPGIFIPLFERNGLIQRVDAYAWREAAAHVRSWREKYGVCIPVSVNVSRIDMYDPELVETFVRIVEENKIDSKDFLLEITESAYTEDSDQIVGMVKELRSRGFRVEMDDFGTGYSSLNMLSSLPIDVLKLDMRFMQQENDGLGNIRMVKLMIDIADYLEVPVVAEGVETMDQMAMLKDLGCDMVQGYCFSKPLPADEFEALVCRELLS